MKIRERDRDISAKEKIVLTLKNKTKQKTGSYFSSKNIKDQQRIAIWGLQPWWAKWKSLPSQQGKENAFTERKGKRWWGFPSGASGKERTCQCRRCKRHRFHPWVGKISRRRKQQPTPVFLPGESHGQRIDSQSRTQLNNLACTHTSKEVRRTPGKKICGFSLPESLLGRKSLPAGLGYGQRVWERPLLACKL